jgi:hypothetical protein
MTLFRGAGILRRVGFDAVDPTGYYFPGYPEAPPDVLLNDFKRLAGRLAWTSVGRVSGRTSRRRTARRARPTWLWRSDG